MIRRPISLLFFFFSLVSLTRPPLAAATIDTGDATGFPAIRQFHNTFRMWKFRPANDLLRQPHPNIAFLVVKDHSGYASFFPPVAAALPDPHASLKWNHQSASGSRELATYQPIPPGIIDVGWIDLLAPAWTSYAEVPGGDLRLRDDFLRYYRGLDFASVNLMSVPLASRDEFRRRLDSDEPLLPPLPHAEFAVFFSNGGAVEINLASACGTLSLRWLNLETGERGPQDELTGGDWRPLATPFGGRWVAFIGAR